VSVAPKRILLVDDDSDDCELFQEALSELDSCIACLSACDGIDALLKLEQIQPPDMIFLDINMPKMDGWQCLSKLKSMPELRHIPVVMYSTSTHQKEINKALQLGASHFFTKPDSFTELISALKRVFAAPEGEAYPGKHN
jgi:CheY-like chemotaxis protein